MARLGHLSLFWHGCITQHRFFSSELSLRKCMRRPLAPKQAQKRTATSFLATNSSNAAHSPKLSCSRIVIIASNWWELPADAIEHGTAVASAARLASPIQADWHRYWSLSKRF